MTLDDATLSAYLTGDLDEVTSRRVDVALRDDPDLGRRLDELAALLWALQVPPGAAPSAGFEERLNDRLDAAFAAAAAHTTPASGARRASRRWAWSGSLAAALIAAAILGAGALVGFGGSEQADMATAPPAGDAELRLESAQVPEAEDAPDVQLDAAPELPLEDPATAEADEAGAEDRSTARALGLGGPVIAEGTAVIEQEAALAVRYAALPEVGGLLGLDAADATQIAVAYAAALEQAPPLPAGTHPARCLTTVADGLPQPAVVARVELVEYRGVLALAHVVVSASGSGVLDRTEVRLVEADGCVVLAVVEVAPS